MTFETRNARYREANRVYAWSVLRNIDASIGQDFHTLRSIQIDCLLVEADRVRYQRPKHANGSRARYFYDRLQRLASTKV